ncbi:ATP-dependent 6-phosphofructokinase [Azotosporobacter soli]|uniref:ATP-dependent 6-phosphofructokinase n=1 Tax=Azotosporobacter soli TaxID=3055040 RepID=UPI0031FF0B72
MQKRIAVLTSGGDAPGMNAAIRAVARVGAHYGYEVLGVERGYDGLMQGAFLLLDSKAVAGIIHRGGTMLKTARSEEFRKPEGRKLAAEQLKSLGIEDLVVIGGDGSMAGAIALEEECGGWLRTYVIPATIDNDMAGTDYTIGFDTAVNNAFDAINKIRDTTESHERVAVVEVMGRNSGNIALTLGIACGAELVLVPERKMEMPEVCDTLRRGFQRGKLYTIVIVAEGAGDAHDVAAQITKSTGFKCQTTALGYIQRGGHPTALDNLISSELGFHAVECIAKRSGSGMIGWKQERACLVPYAERTVGEKGRFSRLYKMIEILGKH